VSPKKNKPMREQDPEANVLLVRVDLEVETIESSGEADVRSVIHQAGPVRPGRPGGNDRDPERRVSAKR
jgi:hypothetical protein